MDESKGSMTSTSSDDSNLNAPLSSKKENFKHEKLESSSQSMYTENMHVHQRSEFSQQKMKEKSRTKRPYTKKQKAVDDNSIEKPPPKKRGRKSKKEMQLVDKKSEYAQEFQPFKKMKNRSPSQQKVQKPKKAPTSRSKKSSGPPPGPSVFDKKILAGPHLTMKQVLEYILTDHSYCVPPDPLPAVGSNHQMIRYILGPKNGAKAKNLPITASGEPGERSPMGYSRARMQLSLSSTSPLSSKLENLLKRSDSSPLSLGGSSLRFSHSRNALAESRDESDIDIDVESVDPEPEKRVAYDVEKAKEVMNQCEKYVEFARGADTGDSWETKVVKTGWTKSQNGLYDKVVGALHAERLARLTYQTAGDTEPVLRRASLDRTACRVRRIFGEYLWDAKLTQWLHSVLTEFLNFAYLAIYMDVLQTLKAQCPHLVKRMMKLSIIAPLQSAYYGCSNEIPEILTPYLEDTQDEDAPSVEMRTESENDQLMTTSDFSRPSTSALLENSQNKSNEPEIYLPAKSVAPQVEDAMVELHSAANAVALKTLLERQWDPYAPDLLQRLKKLSHNPIFILVAPGAIFTKLSLNRRLKQYHRMFNRVGKVVKVRLTSREALESTSTYTYLEKIVALAKEKIKDMRHYFPDRPLYIVGWGSGSILAARLSVTTGPIDGIIALGFPLHNLREMQDEILKSFGGIKHPILFVIGGLASNNSLTDMELFRRRLACETSLVIVGSGNENLYVARDHREKLLITQSYVDKTVMDEVAYFVNLHSKHNQIIAANISMKPSHFSKSQASSDGQRKSAGLLRGKKRKSSFSDVDHDAFGGSNNDDSRDSYDSEIEKNHDNTVSNSPIKRDIDSVKLPVGAYDYGFDGPKFIPSNKSSNKRKAYYRPDPATNISSITSSSCITASKLLQQSPNAKRRMSKPSGPSQRVPLLNPQSTPRSNSGQMMDIPKDDPTALYKYLSTGTILNEQEQAGQSKVSSLPLVLRQNEGPFTSGNERTVMGASYMNTGVTTDKTSKKKSTSKSKGSRQQKANPPESPASSIVSALSEVTPPASNISSSTPPSSLDMHKFVVQHQQMLRQFEHSQQDRSHSSSQLFKLLSPGAETTDNVNVSTLPLPTTSNVTHGSAELVKLKLVGTQAVSGSSEMTGETRTAIISKQNLLSNMSLPMIRVSRSGSVEDSSLPKPFFVPSATGSQSLLANLPGSSDKLVLATNDGSLMKLSQLDIQNLLKVGRNLQLFSGNSGQSPVNIIVQKPPEPVEPIAQPSVPVQVSTDIGNSQPSVTSAPTVVHHQLSIPSIVLPVPIPTTNTLREHDIAIVETTKLAAAYSSNVVSDENKIDASPAEQPVENEAMDADTDEEMSGLLISSTFSVCPTSGERVIPQSSTEICNTLGESLCGTAEEKTDSSSTSTLMETDGQISVPIHAQHSNDAVTGDSITVSGTSNEPNESTLLAEKDGKNEIISAPTIPVITTSTGDCDQNTKDVLEPEPSISSVDPSSCLPEDAETSTTSTSTSVMPDAFIKDNEELLSVPILVQSTSIPASNADEIKENTARTSKKKIKHNAPDIKTSSTEVAVESKQSSKDETESLSSATATASLPTCSPGTSKSTTPSSNLEMLASECDELLSVPIHVQSPQNITTESSSDEAPTSVKKDDQAASETKTSSGATSDDEKRKSKNNPVRRSARLKSGV